MSWLHKDLLALLRCFRKLGVQLNIEIGAQAWLITITTFAVSIEDSERSIVFFVHYAR
jgi:hypothetical protein